MTTASITSTRELSARSADGLDVRLLWHTDTETISISVFDTRQAEAFEFSVDPGDALDAFRHPFAYAASEGQMP